MVSIENVVAISDGLSLICEVDGCRVAVPRHLISYTSEVKWPGDRGRLVIPEELAVDLALIVRTDADRVEFPHTQVISANALVLMCRVGSRVVAIRLGSVRPGTSIKAKGDRGCLVLTREAAVSLGLA